LESYPLKALFSLNRPLTIYSYFCSYIFVPKYGQKIYFVNNTFFKTLFSSGFYFSQNKCCESIFNSFFGQHFWLLYIKYFEVFFERSLPSNILFLKKKSFKTLFWKLIYAGNPLLYGGVK